MSMHGFDPEFADLPDYIVKVTERIWEGRNVGLIRRHYGEGCVVHTSNGPAVGVPAVIAATLDTLHAFPQRRLLAEDVIWSGSAADGFLSSHRVSAPARHDGNSSFGPPTGQEVHFYAIADCWCIGNQITEEWLVRDNAGIVRQVGQEPEEFANQLAMAEAMADTPSWHLDAARRLRDAGEFRPPVLQDHPAARLVRDSWEAIWQADLAAVNQAYHPACVVQVPEARTLHGRARLDRWLIGYLAAFPDARMVIEHSVVRDDPGHPTRVATRWWMTGTHAGTGAFGPPSGATVLVLGITHSEIIGGQIRREWTILDEIALRKQIALHKG